MQLVASLADDLAELQPVRVKVGRMDLSLDTVVAIFVALISIAALLDLCLNGVGSGLARDP